MAPISRSRAEIRLVRLLARCEEMASSGSPGDWRLEKNVEALEERLLLVKKLTASEKPTDDTLKEYTKKVDFLKSFLATQKMPVTAEKSLANQLLVPARTKTIPTYRNSPTGEQIQIQAASRYGSEMRNDLMMTDKEGTELRHRGPTSGQSMKDADENLKHQKKIHEQIADEMVALTRNLKHNIIASNKVIKEDLQVLAKSNQHADSNLGNLQNESSRLEGHLKKGANWWLWISLALVCGVFVFMILFIRFFPKRYI